VRLRLALLRWASPGFVKRRLLDELARATAAGFGVAPPAWRGRAFDARLAQYAGFTSAEAERVLAAGDRTGVEVVERDLRLQAVELGAQVRRRLRLRSAEAVDSLAVLYRHIGIELSREKGGDLVVSRCLFAHYFSEPVCRMVGALDDGLAAGLSGGGGLEFTERITGGAACCRAGFSARGSGT